MTDKDAHKAGHRKRLRERFLKSSLNGFHDYEAVELLLTYAVPRRDVKPVAKELCRRFGGLKGLYDASFDELTAVSGVGERSARLIMLLKESAGVYLSGAPALRGRIQSPADAVRLLDAACLPGSYAEMHAVYLNSKNEPLAVEAVGDSGRSGARTLARAVVEDALRHNARAIILVSRRDGGKRALTRAERDVVKSIAAAASGADILVHDHIVAGSDGFLSAREDGWLLSR